MVFYKPPCNNVEVPQYFLKKIWADFVLGFHVNYFDITEFQGVGFGSAQDRPHAHQNPLRGPPAPRQEPNPLPQPHGLVSMVDETHESIRRATQNLLRHTTFLATSSQSEQDHLERHTFARSTGGGQGREATGGIQDDSSSLMGPVPHHCSHCGNPCHVPMQEHPTESYLHQVSYCFI